MKKLYLVLPEEIGTISPEIYGHFSEHIGGVFYDGLWVGEDSDVENIRGFRAELVRKFAALGPAVLRWPGGCFAETYDWRDGIGVRDARPVRRSWWTPDDGRLEPNAVGTHEFMDFCRLTGAKPYFAANLTAMTPRDIRDWMDYCNSPAGSTTLARLREENGDREPFGVRYWGVGNENWGGGGNMTPEFYADEFRRYAMLMHNVCPDAALIGCGPNGADFEWTRRFLENYRSSSRMMRGYSVHYYCGSAGDPLRFTQEEWYRQLAQARGMESLLERHWSIIRGFGLESDARLVVDEWGCWHPAGSGPSAGRNLFEQQSTMRDALVSSLTLDVFNNHCDKVIMANVAQLCNNLHCLFFADGRKFALTPTYHVFDLYRPHKDGRAIRVLHNADPIVFDGARSIPALSASASVRDGLLTLTVSNLSFSDPLELELEAFGGRLADRAEVRVLRHDDPHACNTFAYPNEVAPEDAVWNLPVVELPPASVVSIRCPLTL